MALRVQNNHSQYLADEPRLIQTFAKLMESATGCFAQRRSWLRARALAVVLLCSDAPHTLTNWLIAAGRQYVDWSAHYRFFSRACWDIESIFDVILMELSKRMERLPDFFACLDEVHLPKSGKRIAAARYLRNPLGPPFNRGLHWALRFINCCCLLPSGESMRSSTRAVCLDFELAPPAKKPGKRANEDDHKAYAKEQKECAISKRGAQVISSLRRRMDHTGNLSDKRLVMSVDGGFTNKTVFVDIPDRTVLIGRIRKDAKLCSLPPKYSGKGRRRKYGDDLPTPEQMRKAPCIPWQECDIWAAGKLHRVRYKDVGPILWKTGASDHPVRLIVVEPLRYRRTKKSKLQYKDPAYLVVSDTDYNVEEALQCYFHRSQIEVSHRDAKSVIGAGDPQVRNPVSVGKIPAFAMAVYSLMLLASEDAYGTGRTGDYGILAAWRNDRRERASTNEILRLFRQQVQQIGIQSFGGFVSSVNVERTHEKCMYPSAMIAATNGFLSRKPAITNNAKC